MKKDLVNEIMTSMINMYVALTGKDVTIDRYIGESQMGSFIQSVNQELFARYGFKSPNFTVNANDLPVIQGIRIENDFYLSQDDNGEFRMEIVE